MFVEVRAHTDDKAMAHGYMDRLPSRHHFFANV